jgi:hypothetical protein
MPRRSYPSDQSRLKPHVKVHLSIRSHRKTAGVWSENDQLAALLRLWVVAMEQFAAKRDGVVRLNRSQVMEVAGKGRFDVALTSLQRLADVGLMSLRRLGDITEITIAKFAEKQRITPQLRSSQSAESRVQSTENRKKNPPAPLRGSRARPKKPVLPPEFTPLEHEQYVKLAESPATQSIQAKLQAMHETRHARVTPTVIKAWHELIYPKLVARGIRDQWQALSRNWWPQAGVLEVKAACLRVAELLRRKREREAEEFERAEAELPPLPLKIHRMTPGGSPRL